MLGETESQPIDSGAEETSLEDSFGQIAKNTSRKLVVLVGVAIALWLLVHNTSLGSHLRDWNTLVDLFREVHGAKAYAYFVIISALLMIAGTPRLLMWALGGFAFGLVQGIFWSSLSSLLGSLIVFHAARWGGRAWLLNRFGQNRFFRIITHAKPTILSVALTRLLPVSNAITNVGLALSSVGDRAFVVGSLIGFLPQGVVAVAVGAGMDKDAVWPSVILVCATCLLVIGVYYWKTRRSTSR